MKVKFSRSIVIYFFIVTVCVFLMSNVEKKVGIAFEGVSFLGQIMTKYFYAYVFLFMADVIVWFSGRSKTVHEFFYNDSKKHTMLVFFFFITGIILITSVFERFMPFNITTLSLLDEIVLKYVYAIFFLFLGKAILYARNRSRAIDGIFRPDMRNQKHIQNNQPVDEKSEKI